MTFKKHQIMFNVWFHSWLCIIFQPIPNIPTFSLDLCCVTLLRIFRQIAQIEHLSYAYFRVLFLACDGRRRGDPNVLVTCVMRYESAEACRVNIMFCKPKLLPVYIS